MNDTKAQRTHSVFSCFPVYEYRYAIIYCLIVFKLLLKINRCTADPESDPIYFGMTIE